MRIDVDLLCTSYHVDERRLPDAGGAGDDDDWRAAGEGHLGEGGGKEGGPGIGAGPMLITSVPN